MMLVYLVQHGKAKTKEEDSKRPLSKEGKNDIEKIALFLKNLKIKVESIMHSDKLRAKESAEILSKNINTNNGLKEIPGLQPNDIVEPIATFIKQQSNDIMFVGHLPFMDKLSSLLITKNQDNKIIAFQQGAVICMERDNENEEIETFSLKWMITPDLIH